MIRSFWAKEKFTLRPAKEWKLLQDEEEDRLEFYIRNVENANNVEADKAKGYVITDRKDLKAIKTSDYKNVSEYRGYTLVYHDEPTPRIGFHRPESKKEGDKKGFTLGQTWSCMVNFMIDQKFCGCQLTLPIDKPESWNQLNENNVEVLGYVKLSMVDYCKLKPQMPKEKKHVDLVPRECD